MPLLFQSFLVQRTPRVPSPSSLNTPPLHFLPSLFPSFLTSGSLFPSGLLMAMFLSEEPVQFQFPLVDATFTRDEIHELLSFVHSESPVNSESPINSTSGSETGRTVYSVNERKRRRMVSNRESARRSRLRKKMHLENVTNEVDRLKSENRELKNRLCLFSHQCQIVQRETNRLQTESFLLRQKLSGLCRILVDMNFQ